ncbi:hypothetical protein Vafri_17668 [Volvox africanus]|uniref:Uncharacterized protein n=1 Tax=Volvox africanus TaxID=51714 RepID=A0A8J4BL33_9CHLO|nr:hypothetical protein Vafri_17668 [Volvox africanus]
MRAEYQRQYRKKLKAKKQAAALAAAVARSTAAAGAAPMLPGAPPRCCTGDSGRGGSNGNSGRYSTAVPLSTAGGNPAASPGHLSAQMLPPAGAAATPAPTDRSGKTTARAAQPTLTGDLSEVLRPSPQ